MSEGANSIDPKVWEQVFAIVSGEEPRGTDFKRVSDRMWWYGNPGVSHSVRYWIFETNRRMGNVPGLKLAGKWRFSTSAELTDATFKNLWYYGLELGNSIHLVGGCTDFSGEGNHARLLAEAYLESLPLETRTESAGFLIDWAVEGFGLGGG